MHAFLNADQNRDQFKNTGQHLMNQGQGQDSVVASLLLFCAAVLIGTH